MSLRGFPAGFKSITGYILPEGRVAKANQDDLSESEDEEEDRQPEFLDMKEMNSVSTGGKLFKTSVLASKEVDFMVGDRKFRVEGRFPLRDPWLEISCAVRQGQRKLYVKGYPSYSLRTDLRSEGRSILSLFLTACGTLPEFVKTFMEWLPRNRHVEPVNVLDALQDFEDSKPEHKAIAEELKSRVSYSAAGTHVRVASLYPEIMKYLPTLLPGQFMEIISKGKMERPPETTERDSTQPSSDTQSKTDVLDKLEELIKTDVWKLGFNYIMFKELHLIRCEAKVDAFKQCNLFWKIPVLQRNALLMYAEVKGYCSITGSTYIEMEKLVEKMRWEVGVEGAWAAGHFLVELGVLKREKKKLALRNLFNYEKGIADCLRCLVEEDPWTIKLDVRDVLRKAQLERLRSKAHDKDDMTHKKSDDDDDDDVKSSVMEQGDDHDLAFAQPGTSNMDHTTNGAMLPCYDCPQESSSPPIDSALNDSTYLDLDPSTIELDPDQVRAAEMMCANPVTVISGKGGCGKTTVVSLVFKAAMQQQTSDREEVLKACEDFQNDSQGSSNGLLPPDPPKEKNENEESDGNEKPMEVLLTAPTGRAASLLTKRTSFTAYTMHQVLWSFMNAKKDPLGQPQDWKFSKVRVLVVDEGSLVSVQILHSILSMLTKHAQLQKFIILGDVRQLPSIEPGNTLFDLFEGLRKVSWAIEMQTNHRAESELIVRNAGLISEMGMKRYYNPLEFDAIIDMRRHSTLPSSDNRFIFVQIDGEDYCFNLQNAIKFLLAHAPGLKDDRTSQFVAFRRKDCELINELCCTHYSNHVTKTYKNKINFQRGDKVCCTKNGYITDKDNESKNEQTSRDRAPNSRDRASDFQDYASESHEGAGLFCETARSQKETEQKKEKKERLCNGEIFFIKQDVTEEDTGARRRKRRYLTLDDENGRIVTSTYRELQRECKLRHAWARTIHTFQGSEAETIVYVLGDSRAQNWQHVYTAVTRGQKRVYVIGKESDIERAITKPIIRRNTRLGSLIKMTVAREGLEGEDTLTQSGSSQRAVETPVKKISAFVPSQSTPVTHMHNPKFSQASSSTRPACARHLYKEETGQNLEISNTSLQDDMAFSQNYSWSPMDFSDESSTVLDENVSEISDHVEERVAFEGISSSPNESNRASKRSVLSDNYTTPNKLPKQTTSEESPLGSSRLKLLSITSPRPKSHSKRLFEDKNQPENDSTD